MAKILVVDDQNDSRDLVAFIMERDGHRVRTAANGRACLDSVAREKPDLILLDIMMPEMDGYTVSTKLSEDDETRSIPILVLSAKGEMRDMFQMSANVKGYIGKPFDPDDLRERVRKALSAG